MLPFIVILWLWTLPWQAQTAVEYPLAQIRVTERLFLRAEPSPLAENSGRARWGDTLLIYEHQGGWGRTPDGWVWLRSQTLEPAVVQYSAVLSADIDLYPTPDAAVSATLAVNSTVGVLALFEDHALVYSSNQAGWVDRAAIEITSPTPELLDFVEQDAYVKVLSSPLYAQAGDTSQLLGEIPLGRQVQVVARQGEWVLVRAVPFYGWSLAEDFDMLPQAVARGTINAGPINLRAAPVDGMVLNVMDYQEPFLILGRTTAGDWLLIRAIKQGNQLDGWVAAQFVTFEGAIEDLPIMTE